MARPKRREREIEQARLNILDAAAEVFSRDGYSRASMAEIAKAAGYSAPTLYSYFRGKAGILEGLKDLVERETDTLFAVSFPDGLNLRQKLELLVRRQNVWVAKRKNAFIFFNLRGGGGSGGVVEGC